MENFSHKDKYSKTASGKQLYWKYNTVQIFKEIPVIVFQILPYEFTLIPMKSLQFVPG